MDPLPPRHEIERRLKQSVVIENTSPHDHVARLAAHGCEECGADLVFGLYGLTTPTTNTQTLSQPKPEPEPEPEPEEEPDLKLEHQKGEHQIQSELVVQHDVVTSQSVAVTEDLKVQLATVTADAARMKAELGTLRDSYAQELLSTEKRFNLALQAAATATQHAERKYVAHVNTGRLHLVTFGLTLACASQVQSGGAGERAG